MIEIIASGIGLDSDTAVFNALKNAVIQETRVLVESTTLVDNGKLIESTIITRNFAYINAYKILELSVKSNTWTARVICLVNEQELLKDIKLNIPATSGMYINGTQVALLNWQRSLIEKDIYQKEEQLKNKKCLELHNLEKFINNPYYRSTFLLELKSFSITINSKVIINLDINAALPPNDLNPKFFKTGETYCSLKAYLLDKSGSVLYETIVPAWYPWKSAYFFVNLDPEIIAKVHKVTISWI